MGPTLAVKRAVRGSASSRGSAEGKGGGRRPAPIPRQPSRTVATLTTGGQRLSHALPGAR
eukprot:4317212-Pyramimonas_sp.AAC.1